MTARLADVKRDLEALTTELRDRLQILTGGPVFVFVAYPDLIDEDGDHAAGCWSPETLAEDFEAASVAYVFRTRAEELFAQATGVPWNEEAHKHALALAEAAARK